MPLPQISITELISTCRPSNGGTWGGMSDDIDNRKCLCCGKPGHYQQQLESYVDAHGMSEGVYIHEGVLKDGHHRVLAAMRLGIETIPLESKEDAKARWIRDHGHVSWDDRLVGDV